MVQSEDTKKIDVTQEAFVFLYNRFQDPISMSLEDIAKTLLSASDLKKCYTELHKVVLFKRRN